MAVTCSWNDILIKLSNDTLADMDRDEALATGLSYNQN